MTWTLDYDGDERSPAEWGLSRMHRRLISQRPDVVTLRQAATALESESLFEAESPVLIRRNGAIWFAGAVTRLPSTGTANSEARSYEISGPWWHLENLIYQQIWQEAVSLSNPASSLAGVTKSRVVLGQDHEGEALQVGEQAEAILNYAIDLGAPLQIGSINLDVALPLDEARDLSCAEALRRILRWVPDAAAWFDYAASPVPALHLGRRGTLTARSRSITALRRLEIAPRHDLLRSAVVIKYEKTHADDGFVWNTTTVDASPGGATGEELKALVLTLPLRGSQASYVSQTVHAATIEADQASWWREHHPALRAISAEAIIVENSARDSSLPRELVRGAVAPWMNRTAEADVVSADISYTSTNESVTRRRLAVRLTATNATAQTYRCLSGFTPEEETPSGLAAALFAALGVLHFEGLAEWVEDEVSSAAWLGSRFSLTDGRSEWATMHTLVQEVEENVDEGVTRVHFGPPRHLAPGDLIEWLRMSRQREPSASAAVRGTGRPAAAASIEQGEHHPRENSSSGPGLYQKLTFVHPEESDRTIVLDATDLTQSVTVRLREIAVCVDGAPKRLLALCSEPYDPPEE